MAVFLSLFAGAGLQFFTNAGVPLAGGKIYTYGAGGSTPQATYTTSAGNIAHSNPIILDAAGRVPSGGEIWLTAGASYKFVLQTSSGITIQTLDNIVGGNDFTSILSSLSASGGSNLVGFIQSGLNAVSTTVQNRLRQSVSILDFIPTSEWAAIYAGTSTYDCSAALNSALAAFTSQVTFSNFYTASKEIFFPKGQYYFASTINLKQTVILRGEGQYCDTMLQFANGIDGIIINSYDTYGRGTVSPPYASAASSIIEKMYIFQKPGASTFGRGITLRARATLRNLYVAQFAEDGIHAVATAGGSAQTQGNDNCFYFEYVVSDQNKGYGFLFDGADANAGTCINCSATNNFKGGFYDTSFLGNTFVGCHTEGNGKGTFNVVVSCTIGNNVATVIEGDINSVKAGMIFTSASFTNNLPATVVSVDAPNNQFTASIGAYQTTGRTFCYFSLFQKTGTTTSGSPIVTFSGTNSANNTSSLEASMNVTCANFTKFASISSVDSLTQLTMSENATASGSVTLTFYYPSYKSDDSNARTVFLGCYAEGGQGATYAGGVSNIFGGIHASGVIVAGNTASGIRGATVDASLAFYSNNVVSAGNPYMRLGTNPSNRFLDFYHDSDASFGQGFAISDELSCWTYSTALNTLLAMTLETSAASYNASYMQGGRGAFQANQLFMQGVFLGPYNNGGRYVTYGAAAPTTGTHAQGEIVFNNAPISGGYVGWVCTTGGTPGTWKTFGVIS